MNVAKVIDGHIVDHGVAEGDATLIFAGPDGMSVVPFPEWALKIRLENLSNRATGKLLVWDYNKREFKVRELGNAPSVSTTG